VLTFIRLADIYPSRKKGGGPRVECSYTAMILSRRKRFEFNPPN